MQKELTRIERIRDKITADLWRIFDESDTEDAATRAEVVRALHHIALQAQEALAVTCLTAPDERAAFIKTSERWPIVIEPTNSEEAKRRLLAITEKLGVNLGFDMTAGQQHKRGSDAAFARRWFPQIEAERSRHLWENLSQSEQDQFSQPAGNDQLGKRGARQIQNELFFPLGNTPSPYPR